MKGVKVVHPFLFALWPVLFVYSQNLGLVSFSQTWTSSLVLLGLSLVLFLLFTLVLKSPMKAGAILSLFLLLFFSYTHVHDILWAEHADYSVTTQSMALMVAWAVLFAGGSALFLRINERWQDITRIINVMALVLTVIPLFSIGVYEFGERLLRQDLGLEPFEIAGTVSVQPGTLPNIYYIILDAYARADVLEDLYNYDNSEFLDYLRQDGFFIAERGQANYAHTELSLASSLNLNYLDDLAAQVGLQSSDHLPLWYMIQNNAVVRFLKQQGYTIVALESGFSHTDLKDSDVHLGAQRPWNELEIRLLCSTPIPWLAVRGSVFDPYAAHRQKILYTLDHITDASQLPTPHFVFAHVLAPHGPFVFDEQGNEVEPDQQFDLRDEPHGSSDEQARDRYRKGYTDQLTFVNDKIMSILDELLSQSSPPTIVILQADHGPGSLVDWENPENTYYKEKLAILNAYLLPEDATGLYPEITPVNTFRLIFDSYFGTDLQQLENLSYFSTREHLYEFLDVTDDVRSEKGPSPSD